MLQLRPHVEPSQVALEAPVGTGQAMHDVEPHEFTLMFELQSPPQSWLPLPHVAEQVAAASMHAPAQGFLPVGHVGTHWPCALHVADPPVGTSHAVQDMPQFAGSVSLTHLELQRWYPVSHMSEQVPEMQTGVAFVPEGQTAQAVPQAMKSSSFAQAEPHLCAPVSQVNPHVMPSHDAPMAYRGTGQGMHDVPHAFTS